jgi:hypothetical protein
MTTLASVIRLEDAKLSFACPRLHLPKNSPHSLQQHFKPHKISPAQQQQNNHGSVFPIDPNIFDSSIILTAAKILLPVIDHVDEETPMNGF